MLRASQINHGWIAFGHRPVLDSDWDEDATILIDNIGRCGRLVHSTLGFEMRQAPWTDPVPAYNRKNLPEDKQDTRSWKVAKAPARQQEQWEDEQRAKQVERERIAALEWEEEKARQRKNRIPPESPWFIWPAHEQHIIEQLDNAFRGDLLKLPVHYNHVAELFGLQGHVAHGWLEVYRKAGRVKALPERP